MQESDMILLLELVDDLLRLDEEIKNQSACNHFLCSEN